MPREVIEIPSFSRGIITAADQTDIPLDAAAWSQDIDGEAPEGILRGREGETITTLFNSVTSAKIFTADRKSLTDELQYDLLFQTGRDLKVNTAYDTAGYAVKTLRALSTSNPVCMTDRHREVRIGLPGEDPLWVGYPDNEQFGTSVKGSIHVSSARLSALISLPFLYKIISDGTYIFGIKWRGDTVYRITIADGTLIRGDLGLFTSTQGLCIAANTDYLWIYDARTGTNGTLYYMNKSLAIVAAHTLSAGSTVQSSQAGVSVSDVCATTNKIFLAASWERSTILSTLVDQFVSMASVPGTPTSSSTITFADATPYTNDTYAADYIAGEWYYNIGVSTHARCKCPIASAPRVCLVNLGDNQVGWLTSLRQHPQYGWVYYCTSGGTPPGGTQVTDALQIMTETMTGQKKVPILYTNDNLFAASNMVYNSVSDDMYWARGSALYYDASVTIPSSVGTATKMVNATAGKYFATLDSLSLCWDATNSKLCLSRLNYGPGIFTLSATLMGLATIRSEDAVILTNFAVSGTTNVWMEPTQCYYKFALEYDGYQLSPLNLSPYNGVFTDGSTDSGQKDGRQFDIKIRGGTQLNPRLSGIAIFRATSNSILGEENGLYRLVEVVKFSDSRWVQNSGDATQYEIIGYTDNSASIGAPYETHTGIPETEQENMIQYELSCVCNDELFVTKCFHVDLPDAKQFLLKSQTGRHDMFNLVQNYLRLPFIPTALIAYGGKVFAFSINSMAIINPDGMYIEEVYNDIGCLSQRSLLVMKGELYFADQLGVYCYNGKELINITVPILRSSAQLPSGTGTYYTGSVSTPPILIAHPYRNSILVIKYSGGNAQIFVYNYIRKRWDYWLLSNQGAYNTWGGFTDQYGRAWFSGETQSCYFSSDTRKAWTWYSQYFACGDATQLKKFYEVLGNYTGTVSLSWRYPYGQDFIGYITLGNHITDDSGDINYVKSRVLQLKLTGAANSTLSNMAIIFRRLVGKRA